MKAIDMSDEETRATARQLAEAATTPEAWGPMKPEWIETISRDKGDIWVVTADVDNPEGSAVVAVTGNGPTSEANARFFVHAKRIVLGLLEEQDRLATCLRNTAARHEERDERDQLRAENARLRAALQPFADAYTEERWLDLSTPYDTRHDDTDVAELRYDNTGVTLGMLRRARAALEEP